MFNYRVGLLTSLSKEVYASGKLRCASQVAIELHPWLPTLDLSKTSLNFTFQGAGGLVIALLF